MIWKSTRSILLLCTLIWIIYIISSSFYRLTTYNVYDSHVAHLTNIQSNVININFLEGAPRRGPLQAQISTIQALKAYAKNATKTCHTLSLLGGIQPKYFKDIPFNTRHDIIRNKFKIKLTFNEQRNLHRFNLIYMTAILDKYSSNFLYRVLPRAWNLGNMFHTIYIVGSNIKPEDIANLRRHKNQYYIGVNSADIDRFDDESMSAARPSMLGYVPNPLSNDLIKIASKYALNESLWHSYHARKGCIVYIKKAPPLYEWANATGIKYGCSVFVYGSYNRSELVAAAKNAQFAIISDLWETQGYAFMELMSYNIPLFIIEFRGEEYLENKNESIIFYNFDTEKSGFICAVQEHNVSKSEQYGMLNDCFDNVFLRGIEDKRYVPAKMAMIEYNQCHFVESLLDLALPLIYT